MAPAEIEFDVTAAVRGGQPLTQVGWLFLPDNVTSVRGAMLCLPGGTYDKHYWHLEVPGHPGYTFAEHLAAAGWVVVALDHVGVGASTRPVGQVALDTLAAGDADVARQLRRRLAEGSLHRRCRRFPPYRCSGLGTRWGRA